MTPKLERLMELLSKSTQGQWYVERADDEHAICHEVASDNGLMMIHVYEDLESGYANNKQDAEFIAAAHNDLPEIADEVRELEKDNEVMKFGVHCSAYDELNQQIADLQLQVSKLRGQINHARMFARELECFHQEGCDVCEYENRGLGKWPCPSYQAFEKFLEETEEQQP